MTFDYTLGVPLSETGPNGAATTVSAEYDSFGRLTKLIRPGDSSASPTLTISYTNSNPFIVTLTQKINDTQNFTLARTYDGLGRQTRVNTNNGASIVDFTYGYENNVRVDKQSMPHTGTATHWMKVQYDSLARPLTVTAPDGTVTSYAYNGLETTVTDANTHTTTSVTNIRGQTLSVNAPDGPDLAFDYYDIGNLKTATRSGNAVTMTYDKAGRKIAMDDPDMGVWSYSYDALGNLTSQTDARGCVTTLQYDDLNRLTNKSFSNCPSTVANTAPVTYGYDAGTFGIGHRTSMGIADTDLTSWAYDVRGRVVSEAKQIHTGSGYEQFVTAFTYNSADLPKTMTYPVDNEVVTFNYNNNMQLTKVFNDMGTPGNPADDVNYAKSIGYDSAGRMTQLMRGENAINTIYTYNAWNVQGGRLQNIASTRVSTSAPLQNLNYSYDSIGNIKTITDGQNSGQKQCFRYDNLNRLIQATTYEDAEQGCAAQLGVGNYSEQYDYDDGTGNLSVKNNLTYTYNSGHAHAVSALSNGNSYLYDENGNMTSRHIVNGTETQDFDLVYDAENRLVSVTGSATASFVYDGNGRQIKATTNGVTTIYVGAHYQKQGSSVTKHYFAGAQRVAVRKDSTLSFLLGDHLGSSSVTTNGSGAQTAMQLYTAWGESRFSSGTLNTEFKFTGQREEASLGLYFYNARWMDPQLGRFVQADSIVPGGLQGLDRYAYVGNNPVNFTDPSGHCAYALDSRGGCVGGGGGGGGSGGGGEETPPPPLPLNDWGKRMKDLFDAFRQKYPGTTYVDFMIWILSGEFRGLEQALGEHPDLIEKLAHTALHWIYVNYGEFSENSVLNWLGELQSAHSRWEAWNDSGTIADYTESKDFAAKVVQMMMNPPDEEWKRTTKPWPNGNYWNGERDPITWFPHGYTWGNALMFPSLDVTDIERIAQEGGQEIIFKWGSGNSTFYIFTLSQANSLCSYSPYLACSQ